MSSSKIQEYNLDPNMGLAKESSVQSVLSAIENSGQIKKYFCTPSNNVLYTVLSSQVSVTKEADALTDTGGLTWVVPIVNIYGKVKITVSIKSSYTGTASYGAHFFIWNIDGKVSGDIQYGSMETAYDMLHKGSTYTTYSTELYVADGNLLVFRLSDYQSDNTAYCNLITISGTLTEVPDGGISQV